MKNKERMTGHSASEILDTERYLEHYDLNPMDMPILIEHINEYTPVLLRAIFTNKSHFVEYLMEMKDSNVSMDIISAVVDIVANMSLEHSIILLSNDYTPMYKESKYGFRHGVNSLSEALNITDAEMEESGKYSFECITKFGNRACPKSGAVIVKAVLTSDHTSKFIINCIALLQMVSGTWDMRFQGSGMNSLISKLMKDIGIEGMMGGGSLGPSGFGPFGDKGSGMDC